jgi:RimJ/RimL family protein N-acetyltransferase
VRLAAVPDPLLLDLPETIRTARLELRPPRAGDGPAWLDALRESLPELRRHLGWLPWVASDPTPDSAEVHCRTAQANFIARKDFLFLLLEPASGRVLGAGGLHRPVWSTPKVEVGYWCRTSCHGRGYVTEAVSALVDYAFMQLDAVRVELVTDAANAASRHVAERSGFTLEGVLRQERRAPDGSLRDTCMYSRLRAAAAEADAGAHKPS